MTQFAIAYLANILLISGANDYKSKKISDKDNWLSLCNIYNNKVAMSELAEGSPKMDYDGFKSFMIRMYSEQMVDHQFTPVPLVARTMIIFDEIAEEVVPNKFEKLTDIFEKETGLKLNEYFKLAMSVWAASQKTSTFSRASLTNAQIPRLKNVLCEDKVKKILNILCADYTKIRNLDKKMNKGLDPVLTKNRFNPLLVYPIVETDIKNQGDSYVIPNVTAYVKKAFGGLYWWFHLYFENLGRQQDFRNYFGYIFQEYVGQELKSIYGEENVKPEFKYNNSDFIDWWIKKDNKIYLFEVKAYQFNLASKQTGDKETITLNEIKKICDAIEQVYKNVKDIQVYGKLKIFRDKELIPIIVFMDIPFISTDMFGQWIKEELEKRESSNSQLSGLKDFTVNLMNIEELEFYEDVVDDIDIEDIFSQLKENYQDGFISIIRKAKGKTLRCKRLDKKYYEFWKCIGRPPKKVEDQLFESS